MHRSPCGLVGGRSRRAIAKRMEAETKDLDKPKPKKKKVTREKDLAKLAAAQTKYANQLEKKAVQIAKAFSLFAISP